MGDFLKTERPGTHGIEHHHGSPSFGRRLKWKFFQPPFPSESKYSLDDFDGKKTNSTFPSLNALEEVFWKGRNSVNILPRKTSHLGELWHWLLYLDIYIKSAILCDLLTGWWLSDTFWRGWKRAPPTIGDQGGWNRLLLIIFFCISPGESMVKFTSTAFWCDRDGVFGVGEKSG